MAYSDDDHGRSRRAGVEDREWSHRSGTQWPDDREVDWCCVWSVPCTWRCEAHVSWLSLKTKVYGLWVVWHQNHLDGFFRFGIKTGGSGFPVSASKASQSLWEFLGLGLKIRQALVCRLRHKTDKGRTARDTHRDLAACFTWKQVTLGFPSLALRLAEAR
jgi:hypothetical protein